MKPLRTRDSIPHLLHSVFFPVHSLFLLHALICHPYVPLTSYFFRDFGIQKLFKMQGYLYDCIENVLLLSLPNYVLS